MGKASRTKVDSSRREKIAAQRAAAHRAEQRRRILLVSGCILVVVAIVVAFIVVKVNSGPAKSTASSNGPTGSSLASVVAKTTSVPASTLNAVGDGGGAVSGKPTKITSSALTSNGKPEVLYMGAEYCPYCAAERWAIIVALSRFGTFSGLSTVHSASVNGAGGRAVPEHAHLDVLQVQLHQPVLHIYAGRAADQHPGQVDRHLHQPADADLGADGADRQVRH